MTGLNTRDTIIKAIAEYRPQHPAEKGPANQSSGFGELVFSDREMKERLPRHVYKSLRKTIEQGAQIDAALADVVASTMKDWAIERGATHFTHVFYPLTGLSAEKHDNFLSYDGQGGVITEFSGRMLTQGEPDASSFPSGGLRSTFEARGYTAWDVTSPAYIMENANGATLCIPTAFVSWTGVTLDKKTPILRSTQVLSKQAARVLRIFGIDTALPLTSYAGLEQEFFLVDRMFVLNRPDLHIAGRTLFGAQPAKGQEFGDQYFGVMPQRVQSCLLEAERQLHRLGVPIKTHHNEAAPSQYEIAPMYEAGNLATDHNQLVMTTLRGAARRHRLTCLLHEKPFTGCNGSGKHINYSIGNAELGSLFDPGDTPHENAKFLVFLAAAIRGVHRHAGLLRATVAAASNDQRLGGHEAPPVIMSIFLGEQLSEILEQFRTGAAKSSRKKRFMHVGVDTLPALPADPGDRNRTSPFAFTGNRFEFRALGSGMSAADSITALNVIMAESLEYVADRMEKIMQNDPSRLNEAVETVIRDIMKEHSAVIFNGDGYSEAWRKEAAQRGLPCLRNAPEALGELVTESSIGLFTRYEVLSKVEMKARYEIYLEHYSKSIRTEANLCLQMARTIIYPAGLRYQQELACTAQALQQLGRTPDGKVLDTVSLCLNNLTKSVDKLDQEVQRKVQGTLKLAQHYGDVILPLMSDVRSWADKLETLVPEDLWPLPSYQEMLFIK